MQTSEKYLLETEFGILKGNAENGVISFRGIRYAESKRFHLPKPVHPTQAFQNLAEKPVVCPQKIYPLLEEMIEKSNPNNFEVDESNQYLRITVPKNFQQIKNIPVLVWIHGGSYEIGCGDLPTSDPSLWVKEQEMIVVSVSYRLGLFGFLSDGKKIPANLGLFDMIEALKWIKKYIKIFNGDIENITLLGQSSGGDAIAHLMIADIPENLFKRVIIQSAPLLFRNNRKKMFGELSAQFSEYFEEEDALKMIEFDEKLLPKFKKYGWKSLMPFALKYGEAPLPQEEDAEKRWQKNAKNYDVLIGYNRDETSFYIATTDVFKKYQKNRISRTVLQKMISYSTQKIYGKPSRDFAKLLKYAGGYVMHYTIAPSEKLNDLGASHCFDLPLLFGNEAVWKNAGLTQNIPWEFFEKNGKQLRKAWADFARTGELKKENLPEILKIL